MLTNMIIQSIQSGGISSLLGPLELGANLGSMDPLPLAQDVFSNAIPVLAATTMFSGGVVARGKELIAKLRRSGELKNQMEISHQKLLTAKRVTVLTGAGVSAESGVPTFRGSGGFWKDHDAKRLATPEAFARDPKLVWEFYQYRREQLLNVRPNAGHKALVDFEAFKGDGFTLLTQNVDGLHRVAGSNNMVELHGNIWQVRCTHCDIIEEDRSVPFPELPPKCSHCGGMLRPNIVWFGESYDPTVHRLMQTATESCDLFLVVGTSGLVHPAAGLVEIALLNGAHTMEVNLEETPASEKMSSSFRGKSGEILPRLLKVPT